MAGKKLDQSTVNIGDLFKSRSQLPPHMYGSPRQMSEFVFIVLKSDKFDTKKKHRIDWIKHIIYISYVGGSSRINVWIQTGTSSFEPTKINEIKGKHEKSKRIQNACVEKRH